METIGEDGLGDHGHDFSHVRVIQAEHCHAVERQALGELDEGLLQAREIMVVGFHVIGIDVGDDFDHGREVEEGRIGLIGLGHDEFAGAQLGIGTSAGEAAADDEGRVQPALRQHAGHQAGGGGLAVRAGNGDALLQAHQFAQHHRTRHDGDVLLARGQHLRIVALDGGGGNDGVSALDVLGCMAIADAGTQLRQALGGGVAAQVRAGDAVAQVEQNFSNAAHARAADADKMDVLDAMLHGVTSPSSTRAIASLASRRPCSYAACAMAWHAARSSFCSKPAR